MAIHIVYLGLLVISLIATLLKGMAIVARE